MNAWFRAQWLRRSWFHRLDRLERYLTAQQRVKEGERNGSVPGRKDGGTAEGDPPTMRCAP